MTTADLPAGRESSYGRYEPLSAGVADDVMVASGDGFLIVSSARRVDAWTAVRLPFEGAEWAQAFRTTLATHLQRLPHGVGMLAARYTSESTAAVDAENVLFYNVGGRAFGPLTEDGVAFERAYAAPPAPSREIDWRPEHHQSYESLQLDEDAWRSWQDVARLAAWHDVRLPGIGGSLRVASVWAAVLEAADVVYGHPIPKWFRVELHINRPAHRGISTSLKPLLDGVIAAFHASDHSGEDILASVATASGRSVEVCRDHLADMSKAVLGARRLVHRRGSGIAWNPQDDHCVSSLVTVGDADEVVTMSGSLIAVEPHVRRPIGALKMNAQRG